MNRAPKHSDSYNPPSARTMQSTQDEPGALRLLIAQRRLYSQSKRWLALRLIGMSIIGIAAPVITLLEPNLSVAVGAVAGAWVFLGRTVFLILEKKLSARGAAVQELFDILVFDMPSLGDRTPLPTLEEVTALAGSDEEIASTAQKEKLLQWYAFNPEDSGLTAVAICQRSNAAYSSNLLKTMSRVWLGLVVVWVAALVLLSIGLGFTLGIFLLGIAFPLLPAFLDTFEYWKGIRRASDEREALSREVQLKLETNEVTDEDLLVWQTRMYNLRRDVPQVPDALYNLMRSSNERIMKSVAKQLSDKARTPK